MKLWLQDTWKIILGLLIFAGLITAVVLLFPDNKESEPSVDEYAGSLVRIVIEDPYYEEHSFLAYEIWDLAYEYEGTPVGKELEKLAEQAEDLDDWIEEIIDRARNLNNALPEEHQAW